MEADRLYRLPLQEARHGMMGDYGGSSGVDRNVGFLRYFEGRMIET